ncbi:HEAT repeat domain-containing protein [Lentzea sp. NPDC054927]
MKELVFRGITTRDPQRIRCLGLTVNPSAPDEVLLVLASSDLPDVMEHLSRRRSLPLAIVGLLIGYWRRTGDVAPLGYPSGRRYLSEDLVRELATAHGPAERSVAAEAMPLPVELMEVLVRDDEVEVRLLVAGRPDLPESVAEILVQDPDSYVRRHVVDQVGPQWLPVLARDPEPAIRAFAAWSPATSEDLVDELAHDPDPWVRRTVEERRSPIEKPSSNHTPREVQDSEEERAARPAADPDTPPGVLTDLALGDHNLLVLYKACRNPALPIPAMRRIVEPLRRP